MVQVGRKDVKSEDDLGGSFDYPLPGRYHVVIDDVDESFEKHDSVLVDFRVLAGNKQDQEGKNFREYFSTKTKALDRLSRFAICVGLLKPGQEADVSFVDAIGKQLIVEVEENEYEKDGEKKKNIRISYAGMWSLGNPKVANVPRDAAALKASGQFATEPPKKQDRAEQAEEAASDAAKSSGEDNDWGSLL